MAFGSQELLIADAVLGVFYALTISALIYFSYRTGVRHLRAGALALFFAYLLQLAMTTEHLLGHDWMLAFAHTANLLFCLMMLVVISRIAGSRISLKQVALPAGAGPVICATVLSLFPEQRLAWVAADLPGVLLLGLGAWLLVRRRRSPGAICLLVLLGIHAVCRVLVLSVADTGLAMIVILFDGVAMLLTGSALAMIGSESLLKNLQRKEDTLHQVEQENRRLALQFTQAQKHESLGVLAGGIAHDFNNMLTSILGYTSLAMKKLPPDSDVRKDLYMAMSGARQAVELTSQMLVYAGKGAIEFESVDLSRVVDNMSGLINSIVPRKIHLTNKTVHNLPMIRGDAVQLGQVAMNLVANAVDAIEGKNGTVTLTTGLSEVSEALLGQGYFAKAHEPGAFVFIRVEDSGVGIDPDQMERIFDPFYSEKSQSKGLGLSSIAGIVRQHKGFITVDSMKDEGSTFTVYFPVVAYRDADGINAGGFAPASLQARARVLLADDDPRIRSLIASILESDGYAVVAVEDGRESLRQIETSDESFDLYLLDCTMPKLSGTEVYRELRGRGYSAPVILLSGYHQDQVIRDIDQDNDAYFIKKPFSIEELNQIANMALNKRRSQANS